MKDTVNIAFVTDENYFRHMVVSIESIVKNKNKEKKLDIYILDLGLTQHSLEIIEERYADYNDIKLEIIKVNNENLSVYKIKTHVSSAAYAKIYLSNLINKEKIIYLDCDLVCNHDISELWDEFENDICIKAVWNPFYDYDNRYLGIDDGSKTFNSGVMLLDLDLMRKNNISLKLEKFLDKYHDKTKLHDQAAFNAIFKGKWKELDITWNSQVSMLKNSYKRLDISKEKYYELYNNPKIIHFTSNSKPWYFRNMHPQKYIYKKYYRNIFGEITFKDINIKSFLQKVKEYCIYKFYYLINLI